MWDLSADMAAAQADKEKTGLVAGDSPLPMSDTMLFAETTLLLQLVQKAWDETVRTNRNDVLEQTLKHAQDLVAILTVRVMLLRRAKSGA